MIDWMIDVSFIYLLIICYVCLCLFIQLLTNLLFFIYRLIIDWLIPLFTYLLIYLFISFNVFNWLIPFIHLFTYMFVFIYSFIYLVID